jgi:succinate-semialdehyde dehydrogenase/glutarate-semialdehyde dehydrogenase
MSTITDAPAESRTEPVQIPSKRITAQQLKALAARVQSTAGREPMQIEQPFTGKPLGAVPKCSPDDVRAAISRARTVQEAWAQTSFAER